MATFAEEGNVKAAVIAALVADVKLFVDFLFGSLFHEVPSFCDYPIEDTGDLIEVPYRKGRPGQGGPGKNGWVICDTLS